MSWPWADQDSSTAIQTCSIRCHVSKEKKQIAKQKKQVADFIIKTDEICEKKQIKKITFANVR